jgi:hypothetical protein
MDHLPPRLSAKNDINPVALRQFLPGGFLQASIPGEAGRLDDGEQCRRCP